MTSSAARAAEHLAAESARTLVSSLTGLGSVILFSAAVPYQGGTNHVNEQWPDYWSKLFEEKGYLPVDSLRARIWSNPNLDWWYAQNILLFVEQAHLKALDTNDPLRQSLPEIHLILRYP